MTNEAKKFSLDGLIRSFIFIGVGLFFLILAQQAETNQADLVGPSLVPSVVCFLLIILGITTAVRAIFFNSGAQTGAESETLGVQTYLKLAVITLLGFLYIWAFTAFGYLLSTFFTLLAILFIFGIRNISHMALYGACGSFVYYLIFVKLMKIYDPPGSLINMQSILPF